MRVFTNYLKLGEALTQIWINRYTLVLILAILKLTFFTKSLTLALNNSESYILSNCSTIDKMYNNIIENTPHYLGLMGNYMVEKSMIATVKASLETLSLLVYASEELLTFVVDLYLGTYACLIVSAIDGTVDVATNTTEKLLGAVNGTVHDIANDLDDGLDDLSKIINKILSAASKVEDFFTDDDDDDDSDSATNKIKTVNLTISSLRNVYIPSSINEKLESLAAKTPSFDTLKNKTKNELSIPFVYARNEIKKVNVTNIFKNKTLLYTPQLTDINTNGTGICSSNKPEIQLIYKDLIKSVKVITTIFIILMSIAAVVVLIPIGYDEYRKWSRLKELNDTYSLKEPYYMSDDMSAISTLKGSLEDTPDIISTYHTVFNRWQTRIANMFKYLITLGNRTKISRLQSAKLDWFVAYITSERALIILGIGLLALVVCVFQLIIIAVLNKKLTSTSGVSMTSKMKSSLNSSDTLKQDLATWGSQTNLYINSTESYINQEAFGWIDTTTSSINKTVATMIWDIDTALGDMFNGTLLYKPMKTVVKCVIEDKLYAVEKAMTWINNKAHLSIPRINMTEMQSSLSNETSTSTSKISQIVNELTDEMKTGLIKILHAFHHTAMTELYISLAILGVWMIQIPIGFVILLIKEQQLNRCTMLK
ncbi:similar to Saccharomyces cerevisiae YNL279W PRM1 Pheromone-regulated multispanning membrane protein involved in membrane fusion during mating [Maudiozyma saulgeensis]|uniref:Plasma membrane fusion protein PRM1 n=1 Tax=Maudiozyma saulgeensis TaxID=1789683 RepID=A0A1X7R326_9SACH|nr:similar to Saccharomyces cerevisiae YNL279W PRM1 Pheromone-regulated multispanning membrane protein involved in membrane fusion during mating [Kazachstania saulgeensis]